MTRQSNSAVFAISFRKRYFVGRGEAAPALSCWNCIKKLKKSPAVFPYKRMEICLLDRCRLWTAVSITAFWEGGFAAGNGAVFERSFW